MASIKIAVTELSAKKATYTKAARNLREIMSTINKARTSIGNDKMFDRAKQSMKKLVDLLDRRAFELEALAAVIGTSAESYSNAQTHVVTVVSDYKAHKTDFYGNPVHVSGAAGAASGAAAAAAASTTASTTSGQAVHATSTGSGSSSYTPTSETAASNSVSNTSNITPDNSSSSEVSGNIVGNDFSENTVINNYNETNVFVQSSENGFSGDSGISSMNTVASTASSIPKTAPSAASAATEATAGISSGASTGEILGAGAIGAGIGAAATAVGIGAAGLISKKKKEKTDDKSSKDLDRQLENAKKKLSELESEEEMLMSQVSIEEESV